MSETISERKFSQLKKRLESLNYTQPLGLESVPLCERILNDLIKTTEGYQAIKKRNDDIKSSHDKILIEMNPLMTQNQKSSIEIDSLQKELVHIKEDNDKKETQFRITIKNLENEKDDYRALLSQKEGILKSLIDQVLLFLHRTP